MHYLVFFLEHHAPSKQLKEMRFASIAFGLKQASMMASLGVHLTARDNLSNAPPEIIRALKHNTMVMILVGQLIL